MTVKKLSAMAGPAQAQSALFSPNGWIDKSNDLVLCMKVQGAKHQISWKTARLIDDEYSAWLDSWEFALSPDFERQVRAAHETAQHQAALEAAKEAAKQSAKADAVEQRATVGRPGLSAQIAGRNLGG